MLDNKKQQISNKEWDIKHRFHDYYIGLTQQDASDLSLNLKCFTVNRPSSVKILA